MDQQLQKRFRMYEQEELALSQVVSVVRDLLLWLEQTSHYPCTEASAGPLASHLMFALMRLQRGERVEGVENHHVHEEAMSLTSFISWAEHIQREVRQVLGLTLPTEEVDFLLLHIGAFIAYYNDSFLSSGIQ